ncbi:copper-binding protein [Salipiger aestuarii]|uniref:Copper(I)-binding protein n=1 Tax=Salipiger aestuarii TaxID=568098 RepID=A0A327YCH2_9RHOB|nr:copper chaperone PCu(A)C [Salipiger aestuarii]KAA8609487.1 copper-binding protein [Salipiger aestuarii]KAB2542455.1 copper-binding protein [Salipiger aestuarii]RAK18790.1 hypothetical protein ATI53_101169 [Salipiger aestuarii]
MRIVLFTGAAALAFATVAQADIVVRDAYARSAMANAPTGAAFMILENTGDSADRLIGVRSDAAHRVELHTHIADANGIMQMTEVEDGFPIPAHGKHALQRGGDHVMFMGLTSPFEQGASVAVTLTFENAGDVAVDIPVDLDRKPAQGGAHGDGHMQKRN